mgnify:CR=1 FL=1
MSIQTYSVDRFIGLNQSGDENLMSPACTPDAANMCTDGGELLPSNLIMPALTFLHFIERTVLKYRSLLREVLFMHTLKTHGHPFIPIKAHAQNPYTTAHRFASTQRITLLSPTGSTA